MNMRYAKEEEIDDIKEIWNYCFNDEESFVNYYFNNKYDNNNTIVACEDKDIVSSLQLNQYKIKLDGKEYETSYVVGDIYISSSKRKRVYEKNYGILS